MTVLLAPEPVDDDGVDDQIDFHEDPKDTVDQDASQFDINFFLSGRPYLDKILILSDIEFVHRERQEFRGAASAYEQSLVLRVSKYGIFSEQVAQTLEIIVLSARLCPPKLSEAPQSGYATICPTGLPRLVSPSRPKILSPYHF